MGRLAKAGISLLGLVALGGFVSLLGGPSVFSPFSNAISTLFPESEVAVLETEEAKTQDQIPTPPEPEEKELETVGIEEELQKAEEIVATPAPEEITQPAPAIAPPKDPIPKPQASPISVQSPSPTKTPSRSPKDISQSSGGEQYGAPHTKNSSGSGGSGVICVTVGRDPWELKEGERCGNMILKSNNLIQKFES